MRTMATSATEFPAATISPSRSAMASPTLTPAPFSWKSLVARVIAREETWSMASTMFAALASRSNSGLNAKRAETPCCIVRVGSTQTLLEVSASTWPAVPMTMGLLGRIITFAARALSTASTSSPTLGFMLSPLSSALATVLDAPMPLSVNMRCIPSPAATATTATSNCSLPSSDPIGNSTDSDPGNGA